MAETIAQAVKQIKNTVSLRSLNESATKQGMALRLLSLAGWNPFDVSEVVPEYTVGNRRVDYALRPGSANAVFIEVKRPGENLERHQQQLLEYCFQEGVKLAALTNGRTWWLYLPLQAGSWEQRRFLTIDLESQEPDIVEQRFMGYLSQENVSSGRAVSDAEDLVQSQQRAEVTSKTIVEAWNQIIGTPDEILVDLISEATERICGFKPEPELVEQFLSRRVHALSDTPSPSAEPPCRLPPARKFPPTTAAVGPSSAATIRQPQPIDGKNSRPASFTFLENRWRPNSWNDVLIQLCGLINELQPQDFDKVLTIPRSHRPRAKWPYHFSRDQQDLRKPKGIRNSGIYAEVDLTATAMVNLCYDLVRFFGYNQDSLTIEFQ